MVVRILSSTSGERLTLHRFIRPLRLLATTSCDGSDLAAATLPVVVSGCCEWSKRWQNPSVQTEADARAAGPRAQENQAFVCVCVGGGAGRQRRRWQFIRYLGLLLQWRLWLRWMDRVLVELISLALAPAILATDRTSSQLSPDQWEGHLGVQMSRAWNLQLHRSLALATKRVIFSIRSPGEGGGGFWVLEAAFFSSEGKQPLPRQKLGTSTKGVNVMSASTKKPAILIEEASEARKVFSFGAAAKVLWRLEQLWKVSVLRLLWIMLISPKVALRNVLP